MPDIVFVPSTWVDVPDEANPPTPNPPETEAAQFNRMEQGIADVVAHANAVYAVHGGLVWYVAASSVPPTNPPNGLPWWRTDTKESVVNTGTPSVPVWESAAVDPAKLTAADLVTDYVVSGLLPSVPTNSLTLSVPSGVAYASGRRVATTTASHSVPARKSTMVDLSNAGVFSNVDNGVLLEDMEDVWNEKTDADFTQSVITGQLGNAVRFAIGAGAAAGDSVSEAIPTVDLSGYDKIQLKIRSSVATSAGDLQLLIDNSPQVASPVQTLNIPGLTANVWTTVELAYSNVAAGISSIISVGLKYTVDIGAANVDIDEIWALKTAEPAVSANSIRLFEARADADIAQVELVDITTAVNSTIYTVRINGVDVTYTSDASATEGEIALGLVAALNASTDPSVTPITAATSAIAGDASATLTVTADTPGVAFTILVGANLTSTNQVPNSASSVVSVTDKRTLNPTIRGDLVGSATGYTPPWVKTGASSLYAAWGDGNPTKLADVFWNAAVAQAISPAQVGITKARMVRFRLPKTLAVANVRTFPIAAVSSTFSFAIYPAVAGATKVWESGTFSTTANTWQNITANTPFTLTADTDYYFCVASNNGATGTATLLGPRESTHMNIWGADAAPLGGRSIGMVSFGQIAIASGAWTSTLPTLEQPSWTVGMVPIVFLEGTAS